MIIRNANIIPGFQPGFRLDQLLRAGSPVVQAGEHTETFNSPLYGSYNLILFDNNGIGIEYGSLASAGFGYEALGSDVVDYVACKTKDNSILKSAYVAVTAGNHTINFTANYPDTNYVLMLIDNDGIGIGLVKKHAYGFDYKALNNGNVGYLAIKHISNATIKVKNVAVSAGANTITFDTPFNAGTNYALVLVDNDGIGVGYTGKTVNNFSCKALKPGTIGYIAVKHI